jgi:hypothetical protein
MFCGFISALGVFSFLLPRSSFLEEEKANRSVPRSRFKKRHRFPTRSHSKNAIALPPRSLIKSPSRRPAIPFGKGFRFSTRSRQRLHRVVPRYQNTTKG